MNANKQIHFLLFPQYFLPYQRESLQIGLPLICRLYMLSIWTSLKFCHLSMYLSTIYL